MVVSKSTNKRENFMSDQVKADFMFGDSFKLEIGGGYDPSVKIQPNSIHDDGSHSGQSIYFHTGHTDMNPILLHEFATYDPDDDIMAHKAYVTCAGVLDAIGRDPIRDLDGPTVFALLKQICLYYWD